ncbi:hypothetical protein [Acanthamoeba castellanii mimivirus]|uniref:Uncharacterized protein R635 n=5 Tax=Mimivirus TaxID=315393 RepID=YR635_MIMIV|nr:hypothetical protein MIMI_gp0683 [Acanthamoeba polyphaga mimivirus]Q5UR86.1 RecName: Full=Uncharacterized protein R635 [Acanthamoeba polyphaga mimivirus]AHA45209.1 hypothetical protein HIRU_S303 [Hirudovirus strain Sangsue]AHJ40261.1 hypothetical protein [Samba virus]ALR84223.1 hypothetical protein [Niemeyer virus]AMZ03078.1 hypothetical protein [Mimivirus Bombay]BAV61752.1 hypothetical protein [Acanthamoeba castellanii mimivirus]
MELENICSGRVLCGNSACEKCFHKSFASHPYAKYWSENNTESPEFVNLKSASYFEFKCGECHHLFSARPCYVQNKFCPYCLDVKKICVDKNCTECYHKSFASDPLSIFWSDLNERRPRHIPKESHIRGMFNCHECGHNFETSIAVFIKYHKIRQIICPYCSEKMLCRDKNCIKCLTASFASRPEIVFWSSDNKMSPRHIFKNSKVNYIFSCTCGFKFTQSPLCIISSTKWWDRHDCKKYEYLKIECEKPQYFEDFEHYLSLVSAQKSINRIQSIPYIDVFDDIQFDQQSDIQSEPSPIFTTTKSVESADDIGTSGFTESSESTPLSDQPGCEYFEQIESVLGPDIDVDHFFSWYNETVNYNRPLKRQRQMTASEINELNDPNSVYNSPEFDHQGDQKKLTEENGCVVQ